MSDTSSPSTRGDLADTAIVVIGGGAIGVGMAAVLADSGATVALIEPDADRRDAVAEGLRTQAAEMRIAGLGRSDPDGLVARVTTAADLASVSLDPALIVEAGPERCDLKQAIFAEARDWAGPGIPIATTSSALTISEIVDDPAGRHACLVAHCANPPSIVRVIECVPAPETDPAVMAGVMALLDAAGFRPIPLRREIQGFVFNRLQGALLREAYRLVDAGIIDAPDLDRLVSEGLGPRWALSGPFETAELNTPGGIKAHAARLGPAYRAMGEANGEKGAAWSPELVETVHRQRRAVVPEERLPERVAWRRGALARLMAARRPIVEAWPDTPVGEGQDSDG